MYASEYDFLIRCTDSFQCGFSLNCLIVAYTGWAGAWVGGGAWLQSPSLIVDFPSTVRITALLLQGGGNACDCYITQFSLRYWQEGYVVPVDHGFLFSGIRDRFSIIRFQFDPAIEVGIKVCMNNRGIGINESVHLHLIKNKQTFAPHCMINI